MIGCINGINTGGKVGKIYIEMVEGARHPDVIVFLGSEAMGRYYKGYKDIKKNVPHRKNMKTGFTQFSSVEGKGNRRKAMVQKKSPFLTLSDVL